MQFKQIKAVKRLICLKKKHKLENAYVQFQQCNEKTNMLEEFWAMRNVLLFRVNNIFGPYSLHHILIWFLTFQLCQFGF